MAKQMREMHAELEKSRKNNEEKLKNIMIQKEAEQQKALKELERKSEKARREQEEKFQKLEKERKLEAERQMLELKVNLIRFAIILAKMVCYRTLNAFKKSGL